jgi:hypothetical protein
MERDGKESFNQSINLTDIIQNTTIRYDTIRYDTASSHMREINKQNDNDNDDKSN